MCLSIPMRVESVDGLVAYCQAKGAGREVSLLFLQDEPPQPGDYVMVHLGVAMRRVDAEEARQAWALYDEILAQDAAPGEPPPAG